MQQNSTGSAVGLELFAVSLERKKTVVLAQDKTAVIISHRLFVTPMVDRILVLEHGRLVEEGTHQQLMKLDGVYAEMFKIQVGMYWPSSQ